MLFSMTGYGRITQQYKDMTVNVEVKSLNSKYTDIRLKVPQNYREKEPEFRKILMDNIQRGKIEMTIDIKSLAGEDEYGLNTNLFKKYFRELSSLKNELKVEGGDLLQSILRLPNVVATAEDDIDEDEWKAIFKIVSGALVKFDEFRREEGMAMENDLIQRIKNISTLLEQVNPHENDRVDSLRQRLHQKLEEYLGKEKIDENRFEQEILFYLEKIDITEEKVRLKQHCKFFLEVLNNENRIKGRKLSFISQEIGREINTLGAKAYSSSIQRLVVEMKDELEKIKEQVANTV